MSEEDNSFFEYTYNNCKSCKCGSKTDYKCNTCFYPTCLNCSLIYSCCKNIQCHQCIGKLCRKCDNKSEITNNEQTRFKQCVYLKENHYCTCFVEHLQCSCVFCGKLDWNLKKYICEFCKESHPIEVYHLNFPYTDICDSCSLVVIRCEKCNKWGVDDLCNSCQDV
jgi:hypothetical protein